ncbi:hypothetical protein B425_1945 [Bacillus amyloliquefaciens]|nr:hypothetical protein B425_1945 [Bacillus amyloliquefaciens]
MSQYYIRWTRPPFILKNKNIRAASILYVKSLSVQKTECLHDKHETLLPLFRIKQEEDFFRKEYEFVKVELSTMRRRPKEDYREIIHQYAERGWRLVQIFAPSIDGYGAAAYFEIIFERDI